MGSASDSAKAHMAGMPRPELQAAVAKNESDNKLRDIAMLDAVIALCKGRAAA